MTPPSVISSNSAGGERPVGRAATDTDLSYVLRAKKGDQTAFAPLWDKYWRSLYAYFARRVSSREEAEDLASETLLAAFDQIPAFRGQVPQDTENAAPRPHAPDSSAQQCSFQTFLFSIAHHKLAHWIRRKTARRCSAFADLAPAEAEEEDENALAERLGADAEADPLQTLMQQARLDEVCYALADVGMRSSEQFKALFFHYCCELPHKEVASLLDTRSETVNTRLQEGRRTLTRHYKRPMQDYTAASSC
ncbi:MAG TPA: sigma-70 family RNA polymerase sigma factor [Chthonomonadaceae bacterium]|nr:sigma-70 family RNA polymerase sigma factor [Chthonomonadaceae bacterium]